MTFLASYEQSLHQRQVPTSRCPQSPAGRGAAADRPRKTLPMGNKIKTLGGRAGREGGRQDGQLAARALPEGQLEPSRDVRRYRQPTVRAQ